MKTGIPQTLVDWLKSIGLQSAVSNNNIENGHLLGSVMKIAIQDYGLQLLNGNTSVNKASNWDNLIQQLKKIGVKVIPQQKTKILNGNHEIVIQIIFKVRQIYNRNQKQTEVDISKIDAKSDPRKSSSLLQLMIITIIKNFSLNAKESVALLSNDSKYLAHILAKGLKGEFKPIQNFINQLRKNMSIIQQFCKNKENQVFFIKSIKPGIISKSQSVAQFSLDLINNFTKGLPHQDQIFKDSLLGTLALGLRRHPPLAPNIASSILRMSNYSKFLLENLKEHCNANDYQNVVLQIWKCSFIQERVKQVLQMKGFNSLLDLIINNLLKSQSAIGALNFLLLVSEYDSNIVIDTERGPQILQNLAHLSISKKEDRLILINILFGLLSLLGKQKNPVAPNLFKLIIQKYQNSQQGDEGDLYVENLMEIMKTFPSIPCIPILQAMDQRAANISITSIQFQLLKNIFQGEAVDLKMMLIIYNIVSKVMLEDISLGVWSSQFICLLIYKFSNEEIVIDMTQKLIKVCLAVHFANAKKINQKRKPLVGTSKNDADLTKLQLSNKIIEQFLTRVLHLNIKQISYNIEPLIVYSYIQVSAMNKENSQGLLKLIKVIGSPEVLIKKYTQEKLEHQKLSQIKAKSNKKQTKNKYYKNNDIGNSEDHINVLGRKKGMSNLGQQSNPLYLSHLSQANINSDAIKGLEKYQKVYLQKIQKYQKQKAKISQIQERTNNLKKIFQKKLIQIGIKVKTDQQFNFLYQFGTKEKMIQEEKVKGKHQVLIFNYDDQQQRDLKALQYLLKKYNRGLKLTFTQNVGKKIGGVKTFDDHAGKNLLIQISNTWRIIKQCGLDQFINLQQVKYIVRKVNYNLKKDFSQVLNMDFQGFQQFIVQVSYAMFTRPPKDLRGHSIFEMVQETFSRFKLYAIESRIDPKIFQQPESIYYNQTEVIKQLNKKLQQNSNYILPQGYKKIIDKKVVFSYQIFLQAMSPTYKTVYEILDEILFNVLGFHIIEPFTVYETVARVRPALYYVQRGGEIDNINDGSLSHFIKKQVSKFPIKDRQIAKQVAIVLEQAINAVDYGHDQIGLKYENKVIKQKKKREQENKKKQEQQRKKRIQRDKQLKQYLEQQKDKITEKKKQQMQKKKQQQRKQQVQKKKKQREEQQKKKKVEQYIQVKKQEKLKQLNASKQRKRQEKQQFQKKIRQTQQIKRKIQQAKQKKIKQQKQKKINQQQQKKKIKQQEKKKLAEKQKINKQKVQQFKLRKANKIDKSQQKQENNLNG